MAAHSPSKRAVTPPKGRPTPGRNDRSVQRRTFGSTAQWIAVTALLVLAFLALILATT
jgi:hypothetical protein